MAETGQQVSKNQPECWQVRGRKVWECFTLEDSQEMTKVFNLGKTSYRIWKGGTLHHLDFQNMQSMPTRRELRYAKPPPEEPVVPKKVTWKTLIDKKATEVPQKLTLDDMAQRLKEQMRLKAVAEMEAASSERAAQDRASTGEDHFKPQGLRSLNHPCFQDFEKPHFHFTPASREDSFQDFRWQRRLDQCEDEADFVCVLASIYKEILEDPLTDNPEIPVLGNPSQVMSALSMALYMGGARRHPGQPSHWILSSAVEYSRHLADGKRPASPRMNRKLAPLQSSPSMDSWASEASSRRPGSSAAVERPRPGVGVKLQGLRKETPGHASAPSLSKTFSNMSPMSRVGDDENRPNTAPAAFGQMFTAASTALRTLKPTAEKKAARPPGGHRFFVFRMKEGPANRGKSLRIIEAFHEWQKIGAGINAAGVKQFQKKDGDYKWLILNNDPESRLVRLACACSTLWHGLALVHSAPVRISERVHLHSVSRCKQPVGKGGGDGRFSVRVVQNLSAFDCAIDQRIKHNKKCAATVLSAMDAIGGSFLSGMSMGLEEEACMRSDLYYCLHEAGAKALHNNFKDSRGRIIHLPDDGVLECRNVQVFRDNADNGFAEMEQPVEITAVFCLGIMNLNPFQSIDETVRVELTHMDKSAYLAGLRSKFDMLLHAAVEAGVEILTISDKGAGRCHNKGIDLGLALGQAMQRSSRPLPQVILSGSSDFIGIARRSISKNAERPPGY